VRLPSGKTPKGYYLTAFNEALDRYPPSQTATTSQPLESNKSEAFQSATPDELVAFPHGEKPQKINACGVVADEIPQRGHVSSDRDPFGSLRHPKYGLQPEGDFEFPELPECLDRRRKG
jgi:hypothetical protein